MTVVAAAVNSADIAAGSRRQFLQSLKMQYAHDFNIKCEFSCCTLFQKLSQ